MNQQKNDDQRESGVEILRVFENCDFGSAM